MHDETEGADSGVQGGVQKAAGIARQESLVTVPLSRDHDVGSFVCRRSRNVTGFLRNQAADWQEQRLCRVFVVVNPKNTKQIWGYYTLSSSAIVTITMDAKYTEGFPPKIPMAHLGNMGRHDDDALKGIGPGLLLDATVRVAQARESVDAWGIWLHAETEGLVTWYSKMGFERVIPDPKKQKEGEPPPKAMYARIETLLKVLG